MNTFNPVDSGVITVDGKNYERLAIRTHVITEKDNISDVAEQYAKPFMNKGSVLFIAEKAVACTQKRAIPISEIKPRRLAKFLCKFVHKTPHGEGLSGPQTMEMALREGGTLRILLAAFVSAIGKLFGKKGWFYIVAGNSVTSIDPPDAEGLPQYHNCIILGPLNPDEVAREVYKKIGFPVCIVDVNYIGSYILGTSHSKMNRAKISRILKDNPLGNAAEQTPMGIITRQKAIIS